MVSSLLCQSKSLTQLYKEKINHIQEELLKVHHRASICRHSTTSRLPSILPVSMINNSRSCSSSFLTKGLNNWRQSFTKRVWSSKMGTEDTVNSSERFKPLSKSWTNLSLDQLQSHILTNSAISQPRIIIKTSWIIKEDHHQSAQMRGIWFTSQHMSATDQWFFHQQLQTPNLPSTENVQPEKDQDQKRTKSISIPNHLIHQQPTSKLSKSSTTSRFNSSQKNKR